MLFCVAVHVLCCVLFHLCWLTEHMYHLNILYSFILDGIKDIDNGTLTHTTAGIFATYPQPYLSLANGFFDQVF